MKHAGTEALGTLESTLQKLRGLSGITERKPGVFYRKSQALLHFHEDPDGLFADLRTDAGWLRLRVNAAAEQRKLVRLVTTHLAP